MTDAVVAVVMGSRSDWETMSGACDMLDTFGVPYIVDVVSAHRTPEKLFSFATQARDNGLKVIIAGAGGAAHLPGMIAASTSLPVPVSPVIMTETEASAARWAWSIRVCMAGD